MAEDAISSSHYWGLSPSVLEGKLYIVYFSYGGGPWDYTSFCLETLLWKGFQLLWHSLTRLEASAEPILPCFRPGGPCKSQAERVALYRVVFV